MVYSPRVSTERWITKTKAEVTYPFGGKSKEDVPSLHTEKQNDFQICTKSLSALNKCLQSPQRCRGARPVAEERALKHCTETQTPLGPNKQGNGDRYFSEKGKGLSIGFRATAGIIQGKNGSV